MATATALVERIELQLPNHQETIVAGFRRDGSLSLYFGPDPVYQFNSEGQLRRSYAGELLYKADHGRLLALERRRESGHIVMSAQELGAKEADGFLKQLRERLDYLNQSLSSEEWRLISQIPNEAPVVDRLRQWLAAHKQGIVIATAAGVR